MTQDRFELKEAGKYISLEELYDMAKEEIVSELDDMNTEDALYLGNHIRDNNGYETLYENNETNINEILDGWEPWDIIQLDYDDYSDFVYMSYGEPEFTNDVWTDLDTDEIAGEILDGDYTHYLTSDIKDILDDYEEAKEFLENLNPILAEADELLSKYVNCQADVTDLLQFIDKLVRDEKLWEE